MADNDNIIKKWIRTCQECFHKQQTSYPPNHGTNEQRMNTWLDQVCKRCKSPALDFGTEREFDFVTGKEIINEDWLDD